jgi:hypothetical protein
MAFILKSFRGIEIKAFLAHNGIYGEYIILSQDLFKDGKLAYVILISIIPQPLTLNEKPCYQ